MIHHFFTLKLRFWKQFRGWKPPFLSRNSTLEKLQFLARKFKIIWWGFANFCEVNGVAFWSRPPQLCSSSWEMRLRFASAVVFICYWHICGQSNRILTMFSAVFAGPSQLLDTICRWECKSHFFPSVMYRLTLKITKVAKVAITIKSSQRQSRQRQSRQSI